MTRCFFIRSYLALLLLLSAGNLFAAELLHQSDFTYVGAFKLPGGNFGSPNGTFEYSGGFVSGNVYNDPVNGKTLFIPGYLSAGYVSNQVSIAQVTIPSSIKDPNVVGINGLTTATVLQGFDDPSNGKGTQALTGNGFGTLIVYNGKLIGTEAVAYDATCGQSKSAWVAPTNFSQKSQATGPYAFTSPVGPRWIGGGYMALVPPEWQSVLGGKVVSGNGPWSIVSCGSPGPALHVIDADSLTKQPSASTSIASTPLVYYVENATQATLGHWNSNDPNQIVNGKKVPSVTVTDPYGRGTFTIAYEDNSMRVQGVLFADGTRSVLFFGKKGLGPYCYGTGGASGGDCYDPDGTGKGDHAYPYSQFVWAYDVNDLIAAKNGQKNPWDVVPYTGWAFKVPGSSGNTSVGVSWDSASRLAYFVVPCSTVNCVPVVHAFQVGYGAGSSPPPPPSTPTVTISTNPTSITSGSTSTISWTSTNATSCTASAAWSGTKATSGSQSTGNLTATSTYSLTCTGAGGSATQSATVTVTPPPTVPTVTISASPSSIISAASSTLSWSSNNATSCTASGAWSGAKPTSGTQTTGILSATATYTLTCTGPGGSASQSAIVTVTPSTPPPSSSVNVSNVSGLQSAIAGLTSNMTLLLADGTYNLTSTVYLPQNISNVTIKGASGNRDAVIIKGPGMTNSSVRYGFWADNVNGITFQDMTMRDFNEHAIILNGGVDSPVFRNLHIIDIGDQFLKNNPTSDRLNGVDNGILENSLLEYTSTAPDSYTNGIDVHRGKNWIIRGNTFKNFRLAGGLAGPAVLMWNGSSDTTVVRNTFINNQRDISLGLDPSKPLNATDHARGIIANNFIYKTSSIAPDVPIAVFDSPQTKAYYNTVLLNGAYPNAIEYRFNRTTGVDIKNNLTDASIVSRDGASGSVSNNVTNATTGMFVNPSAGDLHLKQTATAAIDKGTTVSVTDDFDNQARPQGAASDIGADEFVGSAVAPPAAPSNLVLQ